MRDKCRVKRFWAGQLDEIGHFVHKRGGVWAFDYDPKSDADDENRSSWTNTSLSRGSMSRSRNATMRAFRIVSVVEMD
jgi:hypothetical protein